MTTGRLVRTGLVAAAAVAALAATAWTHPGGRFKADFAAEEAAAFAEADADGNGKLDATEFAGFHERIRQKMEARRFAALDTDGDGALTQAELSAGRPGPRGGRGRR